ncbi:MAG: multicopper oxidase domain-containing protein [Janthinobacterium lividum]
MYDPTQDMLTHVEATTAIPVEAGAAGPKDTVRVNPGEMANIALTFGLFTGWFMYHCRILEHEDHDLMRPFVAVPPWVSHHDD